MPFETTVCEAKKGNEKRTGGEGYSCPVCGGALVPMRGMMRCGRCAFTLCFGCDPATGALELPGADD